jgi:hypothetical protein
MYLYRNLALSVPAPRERSTLGQEAPAIGVIVDGTQQLRDDVAGNILLFLAPRYFLLDPGNTGAAGATGYVAVSPEKAVASGAQLEGQRTAGQQLGELGAQYIALVNVDDTMKVLQAQPPELYHMVVVDSKAAAQTLAQPGTNWAVLQPRGGGAGAAAASSSSTKGGLNAATLIGAAAGAVVGALVGGPVGAVVGGLAVGAIVNSTQK